MIFMFVRKFRKIEYPREESLVMLIDLYESIFCYYRVIMPLDKVFFRVNLKKEQITINFSTLDGLRSHTNIISSFFLVSFKRDSVYVIYNKFAQLIVTALSKESPHHSATHHCNNYCNYYKMNVNESQLSIIISVTYY